jgi:polar amino acid transport system permease protein
MTSDVRLAPPELEPNADAAQLKIVPARHPLRWAATAVVLVLVAMAGHALVTNKAWDWPTFSVYFFQQSVLSAVLLTVELTFFGVIVGFVLGTLLALMRVSRSPLLRAVSWTYTWIFRSVPLILQLLFWYNLAILYNQLSFGIPFGPSFFSVDTMSLIPPFFAAGLGLALHQAAYAGEIVRAGFLSVDSGQREAAAALGIPGHRQMRKIVLPQAMRAIVPTAANEIIGMVKGTSVVYIMALPELFYQVQVIYTRNGRVIPLLLVATAWYLVLTTVLSVVQYYVERRFSRGALRNLPPTPWQRARHGLGQARAIWRPVAGR